MPGRVVIPGFGIVDFSRDLSDEYLDQLYAHGCPYLKLRNQPKQLAVVKPVMPSMSINQVVKAINETDNYAYALTLQEMYPANQRVTKAIKKFRIVE
jgi:hypothetical protein